MPTFVVVIMTKVTITTTSYGDDRVDIVMIDFCAHTGATGGEALFGYWGDSVCGERVDGLITRAVQWSSIAVHVSHGRSVCLIKCQNDLR